MEAKQNSKNQEVFFIVLEFSHARVLHIIEKIYKNYKKKIIPWIGEKVAKNRKAYDYLEQSIDLFPKQKKFLSSLKKIGFDQTKYINMFNGIVSIHTGYKI